MGRVKICGFSVSLDGFGAGLNQDLEHPLGLGGEQLHRWLINTGTFKKAHGEKGGELGVDNEFAQRSFENLGAWIIGRNMFGPVRGPWASPEWRGWWGKNPPYHVPVFVLTHHPRSPLEMEGGTTFYFITDGVEAALDKARAHSKGKDIRIGGGVSVVRQYLIGGFVDELHLAYSPVFLGAGESLLSGINLRQMGYELVEKSFTDNALHVVLRR